MPATLQSAEWDPEGATFDPKVKFITAHGSPRLGDPSSFRLKGVDIVGLTYVDARKDSGFGDMVGLALIIGVLPGASVPRGGMIFLPVEENKEISEALREGSEKAEAKADSEVLFSMK